MAIAKLTAGQLRNPKPGKYGDGGGLWLVVKDSGEAYWVFRYQLNHKSREMGLGPLKDVSAAEARAVAQRCRNLKREGIDPLTERTERRSVTVQSFRTCAADLIESKRHGWRNEKHAQQWTSTLEAYAYPVMGDLPVNAVTTDHVLRALNPIWATKTETASRLRQRIESVLDYAKARGFRKGDNPAAWRGHLDHLLAKPQKVKRVRHHPAMPYKDLPAFMQELAKQDALGAKALMFTILTAARTGEVLGAKHGEIEDKVWTVPAERMKAHRPHRVPLSVQTLGLVSDLPLDFDNPHLFPGTRKGKPLSGMTMSKALRALDDGGVTVHGFRSAFMDWCAETTNYPRELAEASLAHVLRDKTEAAYQRGDLLERRATLMQAWADYCLPQQAANVVPIQGKRA